MEQIGAVIASGAKQSRPGLMRLQCGSLDKSGVQMGEKMKRGSGLLRSQWRWLIFLRRAGAMTG